MTVLLDPAQFNPIARELTTGVHVARASATLPQTDTEAIFSVSGGRVLVSALVGEVTVVLGTGTAPMLSVAYNPTATGASTTLASATAVTADAVGTVYGIEADGTALTQGVLNLLSAALPARPFLLSEGDIEITTDESITGEIAWDLIYVPFDDGAEVAAA